MHSFIYVCTHLCITPHAVLYILVTAKATRGLSKGGHNELYEQHIELMYFCNNLA